MMPNERNSTYSPQSWINIIIITIIMVSTFASLRILERTEDTFLRKPFSTFPTQIGNWNGNVERFEDKIYQILKVDDSFYANYQDSSNQWINLYIGYYQNQREGELIHSPRNCMPGSGWNIVESEIVPITIDKDANMDININKLILVNGMEKMITYYWYHSRGRIISSEYAQKIYLVWDAITRNRTDGSFVRLIAPIHESEEATMNNLNQFTRIVYPILQEHIPR